MKLTNYRNKHIVIIVMAIQFIFNQIFDLDGLAYVISLLIFSVLVGFFLGTGKFEKQDELTKVNVMKANTIALSAVLIVLVIMGIIGGNLNHNGHSTKFFAEDMYRYIAAGIVILRSITFLILDRTPKNCVEDE